ncbi:hypothetical protein TWF594_007569 [Orbilia oligospora]|nr:hypothetical protein TWF594_007569 [Orbilia oligospora]
MAPRISVLVQEHLHEYACKIVRSPTVSELVLGIMTIIAEYFQDEPSQALAKTKMEYLYHLEESRMINILRLGFSLSKCQWGAPASGLEKKTTATDKDKPIVPNVDLAT